MLPADTETPVSIFLKLAAHEPRAFLFESVEAGERVGRWSLFGLPRAVHRFTAGRSPSPFELLERRAASAHGVRRPGFPPFTGGLVGYLGYDAIARLEPRVKLEGPDELGFDEAVFFEVDTVVAFDNVRRELQVVIQLEGGTPLEQLHRGEIELARICRVLDAPLERFTSERHPAIVFTPRSAPESYLSQVRACQALVDAGECQQIVVSRRFDADSDVPPFELYRALRRVNPSPYLFYFRDDERALIGSSPERLVKVEGDRVTVRPIAGTRRRGVDLAEDERLAEELRADSKENAEHAMLVDLGRNDVGRVSAFGSVKVDQLKTVERYSHVLHMTSQVSGRLAEGRHSVDGLKAAFPAGTLSGAPKVRAMQAIDALEPSRRGPYGGAIGYLDATGDLELAIVIRSFFKNGSRLAVQAGAGIVHDSVPAMELAETEHKAAAMFATAALATSHPGDQVERARERNRPDSTAQRATVEPTQKDRSR